MKKTIINWDELCQLVQDNKKVGKEILLKPIRIYGEKDKKKEDEGIKTVKKIHSITLEVIEK